MLKNLCGTVGDAPFLFRQDPVAVKGYAGDLSAAGAKVGRKDCKRCHIIDISPLQLQNRI